MDCRWLACLVLVGCFDDPPSSQGSSTGAASTETSTSATSEPVTSSSSSSTSTSSGVADVSSSSGGDSSTSSGSSSSTGSPGQCDENQVCAAEPPPPWSGPIVGLVAAADQPQPECPGSLRELWRGGRDPASSCDCTACSGEGVSCGMALAVGDNGFCDDAVFDESGCSALVTNSQGQLSLSFEIEEEKGTTCTPPVPGEPRYRRRAVACEPSGDDCEDGGTCMAGPFCIWQEGEHECPGPFPNRTVVYGGLDTTEPTCDGCNCGVNSLLCEDATITLYADDACMGEVVSSPTLYPDSACAAWVDVEGFVTVDEVGSIDIDPGEPDCSSPFDTVPAQADYTPLMPRTLCCSP